MTQSIDAIWRSLYHRSENFLSEILKIQIQLLYNTVREHNLIEPTSEQQNEFDSAVGGDDFSQVCKALYQLRFDSPVESRPLNFGYFAVYLDRNPSTIRDTQIKKVALLKRRLREVPELARSLLQFRNTMAHNSNKLNDSGHALLHASTIIRLLEIGYIPLAQEKEAQKFRDYCYRNIEAVMKMHSAPEQEESLDVGEPLTGGTPESEIQGKDRRNISTEGVVKSKYEGRITSKNLSADYHFGQLAKQMKGIAENQETLLPWLEALELEVKTIHKSMESGLGTLAEDVVSTNQNLVGLRDGLTAFSVTQNKPEPPDLDEEDLERRIQSLEEKIEEQPEVEEEEWQTKEQASVALLQIRDQIRSQVWDGRQLKNWENILQRPLINDLLEQGVTTLEKWKNTNKFKAKYIAHKDVMDMQLERFWPQIKQILANTETHDPYELNEIPF